MAMNRKDTAQLTDLLGKLMVHTDPTHRPHVFRHAQRLFYLLGGQVAVTDEGLWTVTPKGK